jgi:hypothetical protein
MDTATFRAPEPTECASKEAFEARRAETVLSGFSITLEDNYPDMYLLRIHIHK